MRITIVYDNETLRDNLKADWRFSCLVEVYDRRILFDTGENGSILLYNMNTLHITPGSILDNVVIEVRQYKLDIHYYLGFNGKQDMICTENPQRSLFISSDGTVSPCVFLNIPVSSVTWVTNNTKRLYKRLHFGSIYKNSLSAIWNDKKYTAFRDGFDTNQHDPHCIKCKKLYINLH
ncbi:MAG: hypothetical protein A2161_15010 [Candidatus Schekmanbacteria bacterium RBG_13_48_7]|uniref:4Fe4S-binding SPASM domain-containing protein n=1 Tax=Candidatus Schekmanbacteria bacterium RBG_13_48_7 TaxID=1817878 RepID=A0A1F7RW71_9BACT|nr:MAG: hypothetical protein A2161_15010 [Candidatus Schekmanbacteria bacterium RBG_13_48_7]